MRTFRLIDGVVVAAVALLSLKVLGLFAGADKAERTPPTFGRVFSHARTNFTPPEPGTTGSLADTGKSAAAEPAASPGPAPASLAPPSPSEKALLDRLGNRREELQQRQRELEAREKLLQEQERKLDDRLARDRGAEQSRKDAAAAKQDGDPAALRGVVVMYEAMKPKDAARVFDRLPIEVLVSVATQMNSRKMSEVLAAMTPGTAERLTVALMKRARGGGSDESSPAAVLPGGELPAIEPRVPPAEAGLSRR